MWSSLFLPSLEKNISAGTGPRLQFFNYCRTFVLWQCWSLQPCNERESLCRFQKTYLAFRLGVSKKKTGRRVKSKKAHQKIGPFGGLVVGVGPLAGPQQPGSEPASREHARAAFSCFCSHSRFRSSRSGFRSRSRSRSRSLALALALTLREARGHRAFGVPTHPTSAK